MPNRQQRRLVEKLPAAVVCVGIPSGPLWQAEFSLCLLQAALDTLSYPTPGFGPVEMQFRNIRGSTIWKQRADLVEGAITSGATHLFFVDVDQTFPANAIRRMLYHRKPIMACNVATKQFPSMSTARNKVDGKVIPVLTTQNSKGLEQVWRVGTGVMLIDLKIMAQVEKPWFKVSWGGEQEQYGEDWWFCSQLEKAGIPIFIDHELSWQIGHIGQMTYYHHMVLNEAERAEMERCLPPQVGEELRDGA